MSKIDEIKGRLNHLLHCGINESSHYRLMENTIKNLEHLRPYVELGEIIVDNIELNKYTDYNTIKYYVKEKKLERELKRIDNLVQQIKAAE